MKTSRKRFYRNVLCSIAESDPIEVSGKAKWDLDFVKICTLSPISNTDPHFTINGNTDGNGWSWFKTGVYFGPTSNAMLNWQANP